MCSAGVVSNVFRGGEVEVPWTFVNARGLGLIGISGQHIMSRS